MTKHVEFRVDGELPPKKDGANSMWTKPTEIRRLIALRRRAQEAFSSTGPLSRNIDLAVEIHHPTPTMRSVGDLDNFVTGICDGLMAADARIAQAAEWLAEDVNRVRPTVCVGIVDDAEIVSIRASKVVDEAIWYRVELNGD